MPPRKVEPSSLVLLLSDLHFGKRTRGGFDIEEASRRVESIPSLLVAHGGLPPAIEEIVVIIGGDIAEGENIWPGQNIDLREGGFDQARAAVGSLWAMLMELRRRFRWSCKSFRVVMVPGNHGRTGKASSLRSNWDNMVYSHLMAKAESHPASDMEFIVESTFEEYDVITVRKHRIHIAHHGIKQVSTKAGKADALARMREHRADILVGCHWHRAEIQPVMDGFSITNGSITGVDELGERMALYDPPRQVFFALGDKRGGRTNLLASNWVEFGDAEGPMSDDDYGERGPK